MGGTSSLDKSSRKKELIVSLDGINAAGKTTLFYRLKLGEVVTTNHTTGISMDTLDHNNISLVTADLGGRGNIRLLIKHFYSRINALIFVVDSNDKMGIDIAREKLHNTVKEETFKESVLVIVANKQDITGALTPLEVTEKMDINTIRKTHTCEVFGTSAITGEGLYDMLDWLVDAASRNKAVGMLRENQGCSTIKKDSKSFSFLSSLSYIKQVFSKV